MARDPARRAALAEAATDYALEHGLIGLSLRPLAAAIGTSDRMLLYHFADKDDLVATVLRVSTDRSVEEIRALAPATDVPGSSWASGTRAPRASWSAASGSTSRRPRSACSVRSPTRAWCARPTTGGPPRWSDRVVEAGCPPAAARRVVVLLDAAFMGLQLDLPLDRGNPDQRRAVLDLAEGLAALTGAGRPA